MVRRRSSVPAPTIREILIRARCGQSELERRAGLSRNDAWRYVSGRRTPMIPTLLRMAEALRCDVGDLARALLVAQRDREERREQQRRLRLALGQP